MTLRTVKHSYPWTLLQMRPAIVGAVIMIIGIVLTLVFGGWGWLIIVGAGAVLFFGITIGLFNKKRSNTAYLQVNDETFFINSWIQKPKKAIWGDKVSKTRNQAYLKDNPPLITASRIGSTDLFTLTLPEGKNVYVPRRVAQNEVFKDFFEKVMEDQNNKVLFGSPESAEEFSRVFKIGKEGGTSVAPGTTVS